MPRQFACGVSDFGLGPIDDLSTPDIWPGYGGLFIRRSAHADVRDEAVPDRVAIVGLWGLIPHWSNGGKVRSTFNARSATVAEKPTFRVCKKKENLTNLIGLAQISAVNRAVNNQSGSFSHQWPAVNAGMGIKLNLSTVVAQGRRYTQTLRVFLGCLLPDQYRGDQDDAIPSYGNRQEGSVQLRGIQYSNATRPDLIIGYYGTGLRGAEWARVSRARDARLRDRVYFYVDAGQGVSPEAGIR